MPPGDGATRNNYVTLFPFGPHGGKVAFNYQHTLAITVPRLSHVTKLSHGGRCVGVREIEKHVAIIGRRKDLG